MTVADLLEALVKIEPDTPVCIDINDGLQSNFQDALGVRLLQGATGEQFVVIDSDLRG